MNKTNPTMVQRMECWPLEKLQAYASNARIHPVEQVQQIAASMMEFGVVNPVLIGPDGTIIAGHARVAAVMDGLEVGWLAVRAAPEWSLWPPARSCVSPSRTTWCRR